jgi:hypothetical protein
MMKKILPLIAIFFTCSSALAQTQYINDPSFEQTGAGNIVWTIANSSGFGIMNNAFARTGSYSAGFYSIPNAQNQIYYYQEFTNLSPLYNSRLEFYIKCISSSGSSNDIFGIQKPGPPSFAAPIIYSISGLKSDSASLGGGWKKVTLNIDTIPAGTNIIALISASTTNALAINNYLIDDITLTSGFATDIETLCLTNCDVSIYPTAFENNIMIDNVKEPSCTAIFYNAVGQEIQQNNLSTYDSQTINTSNLTKGIYFLMLKNKDGVVFKNIKIIKR